MSRRSCSEPEAGGGGLSAMKSMVCPVNHGLVRAGVAGEACCAPAAEVVSKRTKISRKEAVSLEPGIEEGRPVEAGLPKLASRKLFPAGEADLE